jgi:hypothetical protein
MENKDGITVLREDHRAVVDLFQQIEETAEPRRRKTLFERVSTELSRHATAEEKVAVAKALAPTRPHPHAPNRPPLNVLAGAGAAIVDRARDVVTRRGHER